MKKIYVAEIYFKSIFWEVSFPDTKETISSTVCLLHWPVSEFDYFFKQPRIWNRKVRGRWVRGRDADGKREREKNLIMSLYWISVSPILADRNIPHFTVMPYSCYWFLAVRTFFNNYLQWWSTGRTEFDQTPLITPGELIKNSNHCHWTRALH